MILLVGFVYGLWITAHPLSLRSAPHIVFSLRCAYAEELRPAAEKK